MHEIFGKEDERKRLGKSRRREQQDRFAAEWEFLENEKEKGKLSIRTSLPVKSTNRSTGGYKPEQETTKNQIERLETQAEERSALIACAVHRTRSIEEDKGRRHKGVS
ncbi:hypothetical protein J6590_046364 [Homalodisca vitripennis]|nr:hypothetical protein J6590_046364 [Homalodisca vitripennis]